MLLFFPSGVPFSFVLLITFSPSTLLCYFPLGLRFFIIFFFVSFISFAYGQTFLHPWPLPPLSVKQINTLTQFFIGLANFSDHPSLTSLTCFAKFVQRMFYLFCLLVFIICLLNSFRIWILQLLYLSVHYFSQETKYSYKILQPEIYLRYGIMSNHLPKLRTGNAHVYLKPWVPIPIILQLLPSPLRNTYPHSSIILLSI